MLIQDQECGLCHREKGLILNSAMTINRMFVINARMMAQEPICFKASSEDTTHLWHCRYGHLSCSGLKTLKPGNMVRGLPQLTAPTKLCKDCITGKQQREIIPKRSNYRPSQILQLVHSDLCGPITPESSSEMRYIITFIDDFSRKCWVDFLSEKSQALDAFKKFKALVERETCSDQVLEIRQRGRIQLK